MCLVAVEEQFAHLLHNHLQAERVLLELHYTQYYMLHIAAVVVVVAAVASVVVVGCMQGQVEIEQGRQKQDRTV